MDKNTNNISKLFLNCSSLKIVNNTIIKWNTESITDMSSVFRGFTSIKIISGISKWKTGKVINMASMFYECKNVEEIKLDKWNTENSKFFSGMFYEC